MKTKLLGLSIAFSSFIALTAFAEPTVITDVVVTHSLLVRLADTANMSVPHAAIGGHVKFTGDLPVYVTVKMGNQVYTQPTDVDGSFAFYVYTNYTNQYSIKAWAVANGTKTLDVTKTLQLN